MKTLVQFSREKLKIKDTIGTFILVLVGIGVTMQGSKCGIDGALGGGLGVTLGIYACANISNGHLNPAVTIAWTIQGRLGKSNVDNFKMMVVYMSAQFLGAFIASGLACLVYFDKIDWNMDPVHGTCLLATCAQTDYSNSQFVMLLDQMTGTWILVSTMLAATDPYNAQPGGMTPLVVGLAVTTVGLSYGSNAGGAINPARDFSPRCIASIIFGYEAFSGSAQVLNSEHFFWIPFVGPLIGGIFAGLTYMSFIHAHWDVSDEDKDDQSSTESLIEEDLMNL